MTREFDSFVILAGMRTGSNQLEETLNSIEGITGHGELFNPIHMGHPKRLEVLGVSLEARNADPLPLLDLLQAEPGINGFRLFHDHDPRVFERVIDDPRCAKIVLTRNPVESYISLKIAYNTERWRLYDVRDRRRFKSPFKPAEFEAFLADSQEYQLRILRRLQISGQAGFYIDYQDILDKDVLAGLSAFLGVPGGMANAVTGLIVQNPEHMSEKVRNFPEMEQALARLDWFDLSRTPIFEPRRGPSVPRFVAAADAPLLYMPIRPELDERIAAWLNAIGTGGLIGDFTRKTLRQWQKSQSGQRSFTVVRHPLGRVHWAFCNLILSGEMAELRELLRWNFDVIMPPADEVAAMDAGAYHAALLAFLKFLKPHLNAQTPARVEPVWASQRVLIDGFGQLALPDMICREDRLEADLACLADAVGVVPPPLPPAQADTGPVPLAEVYDEQLETATRAAYPHDFTTFGFGDWQPAG